MSHRTLSGVLLVGFAILQGCTAVETVRGGAKQMVKDFTPQSWDEENPADDPGDPWIAAAANEGRADQKVEHSNDPLHLRQYIISNKARSIENNVGIAENE
jgi:hypothetical protein